jgi:hypothetical protein
LQSRLARICRSLAAIGIAAPLLVAFFAEAAVGIEDSRGSCRRRFGCRDCRGRGCTARDPWYPACAFVWLDPPSSNGALTIVDEHDAAGARAWAESVWHAWAGLAGIFR